MAINPLSQPNSTGIHLIESLAPQPKREIRGVKVGQSLPQLQKLSITKTDTGNEIGRPAGITHSIQTATYYPYNAEDEDNVGSKKVKGIDDSGWGCAWRSIQTSISS